MADSKLQVPGKKSGGTNYPRNFQPIVFDGFKGLNTKPARMAIGDQECFWLNNWMPLGKNNLRTLWDIGASIYTVNVTTWNPNVLNPEVVLTGGDLIATFDGATIGGVRATTSKSSGNVYFEAIPTGALSHGGAIGVASSAATLDNYLGADHYGYGITPNGNVWHNGVVVAVVSPYALGQVVGIAVAASSQLMWQRVGLGPWNANVAANPSTLTGGISVSDITDYWPMATGSET